MKHVLWISFIIILSSSVFAENNVTTLEERVKSLENTVYNKNRLVPYKDIDYLYEVVVDQDEYQFENAVKFTEESNITKVKWNKSFWGADTYTFIDDRGKQIPLTSNDVVLTAIEEDLNIEKESNTTTIKRINKIYKELNCEDWDTDRIRVMTTLNQITRINTVAYGFGIMVFPSYQKYIPGRFDLLRRYAIYVSLGKALEEREIKIDGAIYSAGVNIELQNGFGVNIGYSLYSVSKDMTDNYKQEGSLSLGITLSTDLFRVLFQNFK